MLSRYGIARISLKAQPVPLLGLLLSTFCSLGKRKHSNSLIYILISLDCFDRLPQVIHTVIRCGLSGANFVAHSYPYRSEIRPREGVVYNTYVKKGGLSFDS